MNEQRIPYLTLENYDSKLIEWRSILEPFSKREKAFDINNAALLVVDMQEYFLDKKSHAYTAPGEIVENNITHLVTNFHEKNRPVIFTYFSVKKGEPDPLGNFWKNNSISDDTLSENLDIQPGDLVLRKNSYSTFRAPEAAKLKNLLNKSDTKNIIICGVLTNLCCETAAREAFEEHFNVFVPMDATATKSEELHLASLKNMAYGFATIRSTNDFLQ